MPNKPPLSETHPELAREADGWDPSTVTQGSGKRLPWKCPKEHKWVAKVYHRTNNAGCPYCAGKLAIKGETDLATTHPDLAAEADGWDPTTVGSGSARRVPWQCKRGHQWVAVVHNRARGVGCPYCAGKLAIKGETDLATTHPDLAAEADGWDPTTVSRGSDVKRLWRCSNGHSWIVSPNSRTSKEITGCPVCSNRKLLIGFNDLATCFPDISYEAYGWNPSEILQNSTLKLNWQCSIGHVWSAKVNVRTQMMTGCPVCANQSVWQGYNDLATHAPDLAMEADGWDPSLVLKTSTAKKKWRCSLGHTWSTSVVSRVNRKWNCPYCSGQRVLTGFNDLTTCFPDLAMEADGWDPSLVLKTSTAKKKWRCSLGHTWLTQVQHRTRNKSGCPICSGREVLPGFNDLATTHPNLALEAEGWSPNSVVAGSDKKLTWKCQVGHVWRARVANRAILQRGCPSCSRTGYDPQKRGYLYLLTKSDYEVLQVGISNNLKNRLATHFSNGWKLLDTRGPMNGQLAFEVEQNILRYLDGNAISRGRAAFDEKFDGYTESWLSTDLTVSSLYELIKLVDDWEDKLQVEQLS